MTHATSHVVQSKRVYTKMRRRAIPDAYPMGRGSGRPDRKRWHLLEHTKPLCGQVDAGDIIWHAPYAAVKDKRICDRCWGRYSWQDVAHDFEYRDLGYLTPCKVWTRGRQSEGYGSRGRDRRNRNVHREAYIAEYGEIPEGHIIHHLCGQKTCFEPTHMEAMSRADHLRHHEIWRNSPRSRKGARRG